MPLVVADAGPLHYLVLTGDIDLLPELFERVLVLMDDREGVAVARGRGLDVTGTLGVLDLAARRGLIDLAAASSVSRQRAFTTGRDCSMRCWRGTSPGTAESDHETCGAQDRGGIL